ncbi:ATP phosphoribosyltransferase [Parvularcula sp. LCG005]|uniref:ATP phosphoribosyltransferase n=1 Tax=Parvularcula sp. LCG005 TaxID=3078805 RepID=UPI0029434B95|nr:ATP phosphoribosyltransferase [Parvularcula sp. LCG005]WOI53773.1 ATP phosphoribosyltransferase [Parvularcula sp. LCG005]
MAGSEKNSMENGRLRLAVQKSGRLSDDTFELLRQCGLKVSQSRTRLYARIEELPIDLLLVRDDDIPELVSNGASDLGIVGGNVFEEERLSREVPLDAEIVMPLGFSKCRLCIAMPKSKAYAQASDLAGKRIATSYPAITQAWLHENGVTDAKTVNMSGAHEIAPRLGVAEAICDIVSTGATLESNGLGVAETVYFSEALLIGPTAKLSPQKKATLDALTGRLQGVLRSRNAKYVMMNAPRDAVDAISAVLPGADSPTVLELAGQTGKVAIHAVCSEDVLWDHLAELKSLGASAILVLDIDKMLT